MTENGQREQTTNMVGYVRIARGPFLLEDSCVSPGATYAPTAPGADSDLLPRGVAMIAHRGQALEVVVSRGMSGVAVRDGVSFELGELWEAGSIAPARGGLGRMVLRTRDRLELRRDDYRITIEAEPQVLPGSLPEADDPERRTSRVSGAVSAALHLVVLLLAFMIPAQGVALDLEDDLELSERYLPTDTFASVPVPLRTQGRDEQANVVDAEVERLVKASLPQRESEPGPIASKSTRPSPRRWAEGRPEGQREANNSGALEVFSKQGALALGDLDASTRNLTPGASAASPALGLPGGLGGVPKPGAAPGERFKVAPGGLPDGVRRRGRGDEGMLEELPKDDRRPLVPTFRPGPPVVQGSLSKAIIRSRIRANRARFRYCYEQGLQRQPGLQGRVVVHFTIAPTGRVTTANAASSMGDAAVQGCIAASVRRLKFPEFPEGLVRVTYPFTFAPR